MVMMMLNRVVATLEAGVAVMMTLKSEVVVSLEAEMAVTPVAITPVRKPLMLMQVPLRFRFQHSPSTQEDCRFPEHPDQVAEDLV